MWDLRKSDKEFLSTLTQAAVLDGQRWLSSLRQVEGAAHVDGRNGSWRISKRMSARYFGVAQDAADHLFFQALTEAPWPEPRSGSPLPEKAALAHPLAWFPVIPWVLRLGNRKDSLVLTCREIRWEDGKLPPWSLTMGCASSVWEILRSAAESRGDGCRFALGSGDFLPILGWDIRWGEPLLLADVPVESAPLWEAPGREPVFDV